MRNALLATAAKQEKVSTNICAFELATYGAAIFSVSESFCLSGDMFSPGRHSHQSVYSFATWKDKVIESEGTVCGSTSSSVPPLSWRLGAQSQALLAVAVTRWLLRWSAMLRH